MRIKYRRQLLLTAGILAAGSLLIAALTYLWKEETKTLPEHVYPVEIVFPEILKQEEEASFRFLWETANSDPNSPGCGLVPDRSSNPKMCSVAAVGYALAGCGIGAERGYVSVEDARERARLTLTTLLENAQQVEGFFYHFLNMDTGKRYGSCEVSVIDTAIAVNGALFAGEYFGGEIKELAEQIYLRVNWDWYRNPETNQFYMEYLPEKGYHTGSWGIYAEQLMLYFLGAASPTYPVPADMLYQINRQTNLWIGLPSYVMSPANSLFTHQYSHAWFPLQNTVDNLGMDWYANSTSATLQARQFCIDTSSVFRTFGINSWGLTACDGPNGYSGSYGANPDNPNDGTIAPCGAAGSAPFAPEYVAEALKHFYSIDGLTGKYGLVDAYNLEGSSPRFMKDYLGIDKGISLVMLENQRSGLIWNTMARNPYVREGMRLAGITPANERTLENADGISNHEGIQTDALTWSVLPPEEILPEEALRDLTTSGSQTGQGLALSFHGQVSEGTVSFPISSLPDSFSVPDTLRFFACGSTSVKAELSDANGTVLTESSPILLNPKQWKEYQLKLQNPVEKTQLPYTVTLKFTSGKDTVFLDELSLVCSGNRIRNVVISERPYVDSNLHAEFDYFSETGANAKDCYVAYEWQKAASPDGEFTPIPDAVKSHYIPQTEDIGMFLRVIITPVDKKGKSIGASGISTNFCAVSGTVPEALPSILNKVEHNKPAAK